MNLCCLEGAVQGAPLAETGQHELGSGTRRRSRAPDISSTCQHHLVIRPHKIRNGTDPAIAMIHRLLTRSASRVPCTPAIARTGYSRSYARHVHESTPDEPVKHSVKQFMVHLGVSICRDYFLTSFSNPNEHPRKLGGAIPKWKMEF